MKNEKKQIQKIPYLILLLLFSVLTINAQNRITLRGTVTDTNGQPIAGATVGVKGDNTRRTMTDQAGKFTLIVPNNNVTLQVSFISMVTKEVKVAGNTTIKIVLEDDVKLLKEVVVVGYGQQKKESVVASITQTTGKVLERTGGVTNLGQALAGNLPGVVVTTSSGMPGAEDPEILIRAQTTWNNNSPLILVDGIERPMSTIDISSVASISVLKDASATAVFGVKGANGVILITTKTGAAGKPVIRARANSTVKTVAKLPKKLDAYDGLSLKNRVIENTLPAEPSLWPNMTPEEILLKYRYPANAEEWDRYPNVNWEDILFNDYAMSYGANASVSGGTKSVTYFASADYAREGDLIKTYENNRGYKAGYGYDRINVRSNIDFTLTKTTKLSTKLFGSNGVRQFPWDSPSNDNNSAWIAAYRTAPDAMRPIYSDGMYGFYSLANADVQNSISDFATSGIERNTNTQLTTDFIVTQQLDMITKGLSLRANYSFDNTYLEVDRGIDDRYNEPQRKWIDPQTGQVVYKLLQDAGTQLDFYERVRWTTQAGSVDVGQTYRKINYSAQLNYNRSFAKHDLGLMGLFMRERLARGSVFPSYREDWVFRTTYSYASKYLFEANGAYNGSEQFGPDYRFAFFPSLSAGWVISNENFMKSFGFVSNLKLRGSWGKIGNDRTNTERWLYQDQWAYGSSIPTGPQNTNSPYEFYRMTRLGNPNIGWENVEKKNIAMDFDFFKGFISGSVDVFKDLRTDVLMTSGRAIPSYFGLTAPAVNAGRVEGKGYEIDLRFNYKFSNGLRLWANTNMTHAVNKVLFRDDAELLPSYQKQAGWQLGQTRTYIDHGFLKTWDDVYGSTMRSDNDKWKLPGDYNIIDFNADGIINQFDSAPYEYASNPQNTYNATIGFDWKGWSVFAQFYGVNNVTREVRFPTFATYSSSNTAYVEAAYWTKENPDGTVPLPRWGNAIAGAGEGTRYRFDGSYIRLKNAEIAYTLSGKAVSKIGIQSCRLFVNGNNLALWTKLPDDRESNFSTNGGSSAGAYPTAKRFNLGIDVTF